MEKPRCHAFGLHQAHGAGITVRNNRLRVAPGNVLQACGNIGERCLPADRLELAGSLGAAAFEWLQHTLRMVGSLGIAGDFGAQHAACLGMGRIALHPHGNAVFNRR